MVDQVSREISRRVPSRKLLLLNAAESEMDLRNPPGNPAWNGLKVIGPERCRSASIGSGESAFGSERVTPLTSESKITISEVSRHGYD